MTVTEEDASTRDAALVIGVKQDTLCIQPLSRIMETNNTVAIISVAHLGLLRIGTADYESHRESKTSNDKLLVMGDWLWDSGASCIPIYLMAQQLWLTNEDR